MAKVNKIKKYGVEYDIEDARANPENIVATVNNAIDNGEIEVNGEPYDASFLYNESDGGWVEQIDPDLVWELQKHANIRVTYDSVVHSSWTFMQTYCGLSDGEWLEFESITDGVKVNIITINGDGTVYTSYNMFTGDQPLKFERVTPPWLTITPTQQSEQQYQYPFSGPGIYTIELCDSEQYGRIYTATLIVPVNYQATCFKTFYSTPIVANTTGCLKLYPVVDSDIVVSNWLSWADISFPANIAKIRIIKIATLLQTIL